MCCEPSTGLPKGREPYGDGASIVVSGRESRLHGHRGVKGAQGRSEAGFPWTGRQGTRDAKRRHAPAHYPRLRQTATVKETRKPESRMMRQVSCPVRRGAGRKGRKDLARSLPNFDAPRLGFLEEASPSFLAFQEGICEAKIPALLSSPTVSLGFSRQKQGKRSQGHQRSKPHQSGE
jgi:hypothetical protein